MKSETEADKEWVVYLLLVEPTSCLISLIKRGTVASILSNMTRAAGLPFFKLLQHFQLTSALHLTENHEFWYCSRSRFLHNSSETTGSNQNAWEMEKHDGGLIIHAHSSPKKDSGSSSHGPDPWGSYSPYVDLTWGVWFGGGESVPRFW